MNKTQKDLFLETIIRTQSIHLPAVSTIVGVEWEEVKKTILADAKFRKGIEDIFEKFKYEVYQALFSRGLGKTAVKGSLDLPAAKATLALLDSGALLPGSSPKSNPLDDEPKTSGPSLMERIGLSTHTT